MIGRFRPLLIGVVNYGTRLVSYMSMCTHVCLCLILGKATMKRSADTGPAKDDGIQPTGPMRMRVDPDVYYTALEWFLPFLPQRDRLQAASISSSCRDTRFDLVQQCCFWISKCPSTQGKQVAFSAEFRYQVIHLSIPAKFNMSIIAKFPNAMIVRMRSRNFLYPNDTSEPLITSHCSALGGWALLKHIHLKCCRLPVIKYLSNVISLTLNDVAGMPTLDKLSEFKQLRQLIIMHVDLYRAGDYLDVPSLRSLLLHMCDIKPWNELVDPATSHNLTELHLSGRMSFHVQDIVDPDSNANTPNLEKLILNTSTIYGLCCVAKLTQLKHLGLPGYGRLGHNSSIPINLTKMLHLETLELFAIKTFDSREELMVFVPATLIEMKIINYEFVPFARAQDPMLLKILTMSEHPEYLPVPVLDRLDNLTIFSFDAQFQVPVLANLRYLNLGSQVNEAQWIAISQMTQLRVLKIKLNIPDIELLRNLTNLEDLDLNLDLNLDLDLNLTQGACIDAIGLLPQLHTLKIQSNAPLDISSLAALSQLKTLKLLCDKEIDLQPLTNLQSLRFLTLSEDTDCSEVVSALENLIVVCHHKFETDGRCVDRGRCINA